MNKTYKRVPRNVLSTEEDKYCQACVLNGGNGSGAVAKAWPHTTKWSPQARAEKYRELWAVHSPLVSDSIDSLKEQAMKLLANSFESDES